MKQKVVLYLGLITYCFLMLLGILYFKERTVILDSAYHLFSIIYHRSFAIQGNRFGAVLTQIYPLIATKMNLSLQAIAISYSLSFIIFSALTFLLTFFWSKNTKMALSILLFNVLMVTHTFYWPHPELPSGIVFTLFYFGLAEHFLKKNGKFLAFYIATPLFLITIVFFHPLLIFVFFFSTLYFYLIYLEKMKFFMLISLCYLLIFVVKAKFFHSSYESDAMEGLKNVLRQFPHYFDMASNKNLIRYFVRDYYLVPILLFGVVVFYVRRREFYKLLLVAGFFFGFCFIVNINYINGASQFYLEAQYLLLSLFVILPFVYDILPEIKRPQFSFTVIALLLGISLVRIWCAHDFYSNRVDWYRQFLAKTSGLDQKKLVVAPNNAPLNTLLMTWGSSYEFWLLSTLEQGVSRSVIIEENKGEFDLEMGNKKAFISRWGSFDYPQMNQKYFVFRDTSAYNHY
jgi:hypothetical protein